MAVPISSYFLDRFLTTKLPFEGLLDLEEPIMINKGIVIAKAIVITFKRKNP